MINYKTKITLLTLLTLFITSCSSDLNIIKPVTDKINLEETENYSEPDNITSETVLAFETASLQSIINKLLGKDIKQVIKSWFKFALEKNKKIEITKVTITGTNQRVDETGTDSIESDYSGKEILLTISGKFDQNIVNNQNLLFTNEPELLQMSYTGENKPKIKILLNDSILLEPVSGNKSEIKVKINTEAVPDYYLKGMHKLSVLSEKKEKTDILIRIGEPEAPQTSLSPSIDEVQILKVRDIYPDKEGFAFRATHDIGGILKYFEKNMNSFIFSQNAADTPLALKIKGRNLMMFYKFSYSKIDNVFSFGHSTAISKDAEGNIVWESIIHIAEPDKFRKLNEHTISYSTPFGTAIKRF